MSNSGHVDISHQHLSLFLTLPTSLTDKMPTISEQLSDRLLNVYLESEYLLMPIFDAPVLREHYKTFKTQKKPADHWTGAIINLCFALACLGPSAPRVPSAEAFYQHAQSLGPSLVALDNPVHSMQFHILQVQYLIASGKLKLAWEVIACVLRTAQSHGMHTKSPILRAKYEDDTDLIQRLWHAIQILERSLALRLGVVARTFGSSCNALLPSVRDTDWAEDVPGLETGDEKACSLLIDFFNATARLYRISDDILELERDLRFPGSECPLETIRKWDLDDFNKVEKELSDWKASLPRTLRIKCAEATGKTPNPVHSQLANIIRFRHRYLAFRLYRPLFILAQVLSVRCGFCSSDRSHMARDEEPSLNSPAVLGFIRAASSKCVLAAHCLLWDIGHDARTAPDRKFDDIPSLTCEVLDGRYTCGLVIIVSCAMKFNWMDHKQWERHFDMPDMLRQQFLSWEQNIRPAYMKMRISRCVEAFAFFRDHFYDAWDPDKGIKNHGLPHSSWRNLCQRLDLDWAWVEDPSLAVATPGFYEPIPFLPWMESLPVDFDD